MARKGGLILTYVNNYHQLNSTLRSNGSIGSIIHQISMYP